MIQDLKNAFNENYLQEQRMITQVVGSYSSPKAAAADLPLDLILDIVSRLPVDSAIRFRCVCKQWRSLTYRAHFVEQHLKRALERPNIVLVPIGICKYGILPIYHFVSPREEHGIKQFLPPFKLPYDILYAVSNPVNGLVVVYDNNGCDDFYLLNPATREVAKLPEHKFDLYAARHYCRLGFGFDASTGKYKLVRLCQTSKIIEDFYSCEILTVGSQEWRSVGKLPCKVCHAPASFLNGTVYWKAVISGQRVGALAFDIKEEKFRVIPPPADYPTTDCPIIHFFLGQSGGQIFLAHASRPPLESFLRIWMLKDGENPAWKQEYYIDLSYYSDLFTTGYILITNIKDDKIMFYQCPSTFFYDLRRKVLHKCDGNSLPFYYMPESFIYPESLLSDVPIL